jgi:branched-chain amino acid transport system permease protein
MKSIEIVVMVIVGGMGSIPGVVLSSVVLTALPEFLRTFSEFRMMIYALCLIALMMLRPQGLFSGIGKKFR